jgi:hypothetical protein
MPKFLLEVLIGSDILIIMAVEICNFLNGETNKIGGINETDT